MRNRFKEVLQDVSGAVTCRSCKGKGVVWEPSTYMTSTAEHAFESHQEYLKNKPSAEVRKCPVCEGRGELPFDYYKMIID